MKYKAGGKRAQSPSSSAPPSAIPWCWENRKPMQLPKDMSTVERHCEDVAFDLEPCTDECANRYDYGFGLHYSEENGETNRRS